MPPSSVHFHVPADKSSSSSKASGKPESSSHLEAGLVPALERLSGHTIRPGAEVAPDLELGLSPALERPSGYSARPGVAAGSGHVLSKRVDTSRPAASVGVSPLDHGSLPGTLRPPYAFYLHNLHSRGLCTLYMLPAESTSPRRLIVYVFYLHDLDAHRVCAIHLHTF